MLITISARGPFTGWEGATTGSDATHPPAICQHLWGHWRGGGGEVSKGGGGLRATHYYHMHTSRGDVRLGVWGYGGMYVITALSLVFSGNKVFKVAVLTPSPLPACSPLPPD